MLVIIFVPTGWLVLDFSAPYRPIILDVLNFILTYATSDVNNGNFLTIYLSYRKENDQSSSEFHIENFG